MESRAQAGGVRLFRSQHSRGEGNWLRDVLRAGGPDAADAEVVSLQMEWCLDCHRQPEKYLRPKEKVFDMAYEAPADQMALGLELKAKYHIRSAQELTSCSTCHR